jgi:hypothetical protein
MTDDAWYDKPRQALRSLRIVIGLPASGEVAAINTMIKELQYKAENILGTKISFVPIVAMTPSLISLYKEDIVDAFENAGLQLSSIYQSGRYVHETSAAYASYGFDLCSEYMNPSTCNSETHQMPLEYILSFLYTRSALRVIYTTVQSAYYFYSLPVSFYEDWSLGLDAHNEEDYWRRLSDKIQQWVREVAIVVQSTKVLLLGDSTGDQNFRSVLVCGITHATLDSQQLSVLCSVWFLNV